MSNQHTRILRSVERLAALKHTGLMDTETEDSFDRLTRLASKIVDAPVSLISLVDDHRQFFKSQYGAPEPVATERQTPLSHSFCQYVVSSGEMLNVTDAREDALLHDNGAVADMDVISYLGFPLTLADGHTIGSFCVIDHKSRVWTDNEREIIAELARGVMTEIELRQQVRETREAYTLLEEKNDAMSAFSHTVSHNLKNPLSSIIGLAQIARHYPDKMTTEILFSSLKDIESEALRANDIIQALLLLAEIGHVNELKVDEIDMMSILSRALSHFDSQIIETGATVHLPEKLHVSRGYASWIEEVWVNYISNAIKYGGSPPVIEFGSDDSDADYICYWIKDNGAGLTVEQQQQVFVPFSRLAESSNTGKIVSHGLGLSIVQRIINRLGGKTGITSETGKGSVFYFTLPR